MIQGSKALLIGSGATGIIILINKFPEYNRLSDTWTLEKGELKITSKEQKVIRPSAHKTLCICIQRFTELNHTGAKKKIINSEKVDISLKTFAELCGKDISTKKAKERFIKELKTDLNIWKSFTLEGVKEKPYIEINTCFISGYLIKKDVIYVWFSQLYAQYIINLPINKLQNSLYAIDGRSANAYIIGFMLDMHYKMTSNRKKGTYNLYSVKALLAVTNLPDYNDPKVKKIGWQNYLKDRFENHLDTLIKKDVLKDWCYSHSKGVELTDEEAQNITCFNMWYNLYIKFELNEG